jgi:2-dehydro-3-deoxygluconokinase
MSPMNGACMADVVALGEAMFRLTAPEGNRLRRADRLSVHVAGAECNVAVALARLGASAAWISALPENAVGRRVGDEVSGAGVDVAGVSWIAGARLGLFFVDAGVPPRPTSVVYDRAGSAFTALDAFDEALLEGARFAVLSGITPALGAASRALAERFVAAAAAAGARLCLDVNYRAQLWDPAAARDGLAPFLAAASVVICAQRDARTVFGLDGDPGSVATELRDRFAPDADAAVVTSGAAGATGVERDGVPVHEPARPTTVVDRFGAGDAFCAGLLWGMLHGRDLTECLRCAVTLAALKCTVTGDHSLTSAEELAIALAGPAGGEEAIVR